VIWGVTSRLSLISMASGSVCIVELSEIVPAGKLSPSVSRVITVSVICPVFPLVVYFTSSQCS